MLEKIKNVILKIPIIGRFTQIIYILIKNFTIKQFYTIQAKYKKTSGVTTKKRNTELIVSLTTIPERIDKVYLAVETILNQSLKPDKLILWIKKDDFNRQSLYNSSRYTKYLFKQLKKGLEIEFCENLFSYSKIIHTLEKHTDSIIVTADDDLYYKKDWLKELYLSYINDPEYIHCQMARYIEKSGVKRLKTLTDWSKERGKLTLPSINNFAYTGAGCLFPPNSINKEVFNRNSFLKISPHCDDAWLKGMTMLNNVKIKQVNPTSMKLNIIPKTDVKTLVSINLGQGEFDKQIHRIFSKYNLFMKIKS